MAKKASTKKKPAAKKAAKPKAAPAAKKPRTPKGAAAVPAGINEDQKALFLHHLPIIERMRAAVNSATGKLRAAYKQAKTDGSFNKIDFDIGLAMQTPEAEREQKGKVHRILTIAAFMGSDMGKQLDLFAAPPDIGIVERATEEGQRASMEGKAAIPKYDPGTEAYTAYMEAWHAHQATLAGAIKKLDPAKDRGAQNGRAAAPQAPAAADDGEGEQSQIDMPPPPGSPAAKAAEQDAITSGVPTSRSEFAKRQADLAKH